MATDALHRVRPPYDPRGPDEDLGGIRTYYFGGQSREFGGVPFTLVTRGHVGVLRDRDDRSGRTLLEVPPAEGDAGAGEAGLSEHASGDARHAARYD